MVGTASSGEDTADPGPAPVLGEGLGLGELAEVLEALSGSELATVFEALGACDADCIDTAADWLVARSREWLWRWEAERARLALVSTDDPFARMLLRREAVRAEQAHDESERALDRTETALVSRIGNTRAATVMRALGRVQDLARGQAAASGLPPTPGA